MDLSEIKQKKRIAFICSGGAVKAAAFHAGVAMALEEIGFEFVGGLKRDKDEKSPSPASQNSPKIRVYSGSSAGSMVAAFLANGGEIDDLVSAFKRDSSKSGIPGIKYRQMLYPRLSSPTDIFRFNNFFMSFVRDKLVHSPFSTEGVKKYVKNHLIQSDKFSDLKADLFIISTMLNQRRKVIFCNKKSVGENRPVEYRDDVSISDACAASMALPPLYHPYPIQIDGRTEEFFDGELREPMSDHIGRDNNCDLVICSYTHQPVTPIRQVEDSISREGIESITIQAVYHMLEERILASQLQRKKEENYIDEVLKFFREKALPERDAQELCERLEARMIYARNSRYVYIHPDPEDLEMFRLPHFSIKKKHTEAIVRKGIKAGLRAFGLPDSDV